MTFNEIITQWAKWKEENQTAYYACIGIGITIGLLLWFVSALASALAS